LDTPLFGIQRLLSSTIREMAAGDPDDEECNEGEDVAWFSEFEAAYRWNQPTEPEGTKERHEYCVTKTPDSGDD
jgi:hypothetical protein